jgi:hypothetical protein
MKPDHQQEVTEVTESRGKITESIEWISVENDMKPRRGPFGHPIKAHPPSPDHELRRTGRGARR